MKNLKYKVKVASVEVGGRIVMPPVATYRCTDEGFVTDDVCEYYRKRAENPNVSLIITEHNYIMQQGKAKAKQMSIASDECIPGLAKLVQAIHESGAKAISQLNHAGSASPSAETGMAAVGPSAVVLPVNPPMGDMKEPSELTKTQIGEIIKAFANAAVRAKKAGYDGVEIHSAHAYLLNEFYSPLTNKRTDEYGGSLENRLRLHREVIRAVRAEVGEEYPIFLRLGGCDYAPGGNTVEDAIQAAKIIANEGVDLLDVSGGMNRFTIPGHAEPGYFADVSKAIRECVDIPVLVTGGVKTLDDAQMIIDNDAADFVGVGRMLLANADWER